MELISLVKEAFQTVAEHSASYRLGQTALRYLDRTLWVVEKCARWAVPPPLDQDDRPQPELVRPLPWVFFLMMLITLRITRESISLVNLVMGKPPLRSADVVMYIQSKRRYLRTLKYQGNRVLRARSSGTQHSQTWSQTLHSLFEFTMCFRRQSTHYGNNNTTSVSNNDEVLVVKRSKRGREHASPAASTSETTMERLIEKMLVDLDADSDDDASFTLTNVTSVRSDRSDFTIDSDQDVPSHNNTSDKNSIYSHEQNSNENVPENEKCENTANKENIENTANKENIENTANKSQTQSNDVTSNTPNDQRAIKNAANTPVKQRSENAIASPKIHSLNKPQRHTTNTLITEDYDCNTSKMSCDLNVSSTFLLHETSHTESAHHISESSYDFHVSATPEKSRLAVFLANENTQEVQKEEMKKSPETSPSKIPRTPVVEQKIANGRVKGAPSKKKGSKNMEKAK